ncbi:MAG TPA: hypothetical protein DC048_11245 [Planctomycetaceae bacterium]|nr:hypothetical protein [Planctomycetaceae bacterium]
MLDAIDSAFLSRWQDHAGGRLHPNGSAARLGETDVTVHGGAASTPDDASPPPMRTATDDIAAAEIVPLPPPAAAGPGRERSPRPMPPTPIADAPLVERLLAAAWDDWHALAACVEDARLAGRRVIAIAGSRPGEGRSTLVACLAAALRARGRDVVCAQPHDCAEAAGVGSRLHDRRIVLLDAGVWFPPGPLHRQRLMVSSLGVDAAILVRRSDAPGGTARRAALESLGIEVLGEVLTFTPTGETAVGTAAPGDDPR